MAKQIIQGAGTLAVMAAVLLSVITLKFGTYAPDTLHMVLQRIGG